MEIVTEVKLRHWSVEERGGPIRSESFVGLISYTRLPLCRHSDGAAVGHLVQD